MSHRRRLHIYFWILIAIGLVFATRSSPAFADLTGSNLTFAPSVDYAPGETSGSCYIPGEYQTLCFNLDTTSTDGQDATDIAIQFPTDWEVYGRWMGDHYDYSSIEHSCTNGGTMNSALSWMGFGQAGQYWAGDNRVQNEGTSCHALYCFTVSDTTDPGDPPYDDELDATISWSWAGGEGTFPQSVCSNDGVYPQSGFPCDLETELPATVPVCQYETLTIQPETLPAGEAVTYYSQQFTAEDPDGNVLPNDQLWWSYNPGNLPINCSLYTNTGMLECYSYYNNIPFPAGTYNFTVFVDAINSWGDGSRDYTLVINPLLLFDPETLPYGRLNQAFSQLITVSEGAEPYTLTHIAGTLPAGIIFDEATDSFTGTPTEVGTFEGIVVQAVDANLVTKTHTYSLTVLPEHLFTWTPLTPPSGQTAAFTADEGFDSYIWHYASQPGGECNSEVWNGGSRFANISFNGKGGHKVCLDLIDYSPDYVVLYDEQWVTVTNAPPRVDYQWSSPNPSFPGQLVESVAYFYDYDGPGTFTCEVNWGDGTTDTVSADGDNWTCAFPLHAYEAVGEYTIEVSVTDDEGASSPAVTLLQKVVYLYASDSDLVLASNSLPTSINLYGFAPEGTETLDFIISTNPEHGSLGEPAFVECEPYTYLQVARCEGNVVYTPYITDPLYVGYDVFEFTVSDSEGHTSVPATVNLWLDENDPPIADDGTAVVSTGQPSIIGVFATDMDAYEYTVDDLTFTIDTHPQHGTLQYYRDPDVNEWFYDGDWNTIGAQWIQLLTYTPNPGTTATTDTFTFHANDSHQDSNIATVTLTLHTSTALHVNVNDDLVDTEGCNDTHCSLREAIADAQVGDSIDFTLLSLPNTITLTLDGGGELLINKDIQILGPGADQLSISAGFTDPEMNPEDGFRVFHIFNEYWPMEATISGLTIRDGRASAGGGIYVNQVTTLNLSDCVIGPNNIVSYAGGGIEVDYAELNMENCTVIGNEGTGTQGGAGVYVQFGTLNAVNSTITGNITDNYGGGLLAYNGSKVSLIHSTISGNIANHNYETEAWGGGAGIYNADSNVTLQNSIVAGNTDLTDPSEHAKWPDFYGEVASLGGNLIGDDTGSTGWLPSDMVGTSATPVDPLLGTLGIYDPGTTPTYPLLEGSLAIDSVSCAIGVTTDQRGIIRPQGMACDRGAFEVENPLTYLFIPLIQR